MCTRPPTCCLVFNATFGLKSLSIPALEQLFVTLLGVLNPTSFIHAFSEPFLFGKIKCVFNFKTHIHSWTSISGNLDNSNKFLFPLAVRLIEVQLYVYNDILYKCTICTMHHLHTKLLFSENKTSKIWISHELYNCSESNYRTPATDSQNPWGSIEPRLISTGLELCMNMW